MSTYRCYLFRSSAILLRTDKFTSEAAARMTGAAALMWEEDGCDRVEIWKDSEKIIEWAGETADIADDLVVSWPR